MIQLKDKDFKESIKKGVVLVDFYADRCGPCRMVTPILEELSKESKATFYKFDIDNNDLRVLDEFSVSSIPTILIFKDGLLKDKLVGLVSKETLIRKLNNLHGI